MAATPVDDPALQQVVDAELASKAAACYLPADEAGEEYLRNTSCRPCTGGSGAEIAAKGAPLGMVGLESEFGPQRMARFDAEIDRLEAPARRFVFA